MVSIVSASGKNNTHVVSISGPQVEHLLTEYVSVVDGDVIVALREPRGVGVAYDGDGDRGRGLLARVGRVVRYDARLSKKARNSIA